MQLYRTQLCHTQPLRTQLCHTQLCHTQFFHTQLCHTQLCHTQLFHTQLCHTQSFAHNFVTHNLSHTTLSDTIFHTQLCHTQLFTYKYFQIIDPPPSPLSFLLSTFHFSIFLILEEVDLWGYPVL